LHLIKKIRILDKFIGHLTITAWILHELRHCLSSHPMLILSNCMFVGVGDLRKVGDRTVLFHHLFVENTHHVV